MVCEQHYGEKISQILLITNLGIVKMNLSLTRYLKANRRIIIAFGFLTGKLQNRSGNNKLYFHAKTQSLSRRKRSLRLVFFLASLPAGRQVCMKSFSVKYFFLSK